MIPKDTAFQILLFQAWQGTIAFSLTEQRQYKGVHTILFLSRYFVRKI